MQTFLTSPNYTTTAQQLDNKRLNKQALEAWQIMMTNLHLDPAGNYRKPRGWSNHPASRMWKGYEQELMVYIDAMCNEWRRRGYNTTIDGKAHATLEVARRNGLLGDHRIPDWMLDPELFDAITVTHRTALLAKNFDHYHQFGWVEDTGTAPDTYEYIWAVAA
jgi:hypothetical protein